MFSYPGRIFLDNLLFLAKAVIYTAIGALQMAMFARAILSWFPGVGGRFEEFLYTITEPFIEPVRMLLDRFESIAGLPIDISFLVTFILLSLIQSMLGAFL